MQVVVQLAKYCLIVISLTLAACGDSSQSLPNHELTQLKLMSYNLRYASSDLDVWLLRKDKLIQSIRESKPDVLGIQEADGPWMGELTSSLTHYAYVGVGRDDGKTAGEYAAIFYLKQKFELLESGTFWLSETPDIPSFGWGANNRRICTYAYLKNRQTGEVTAHFNTHLDHQSQLAREQGMALIASRIASSPYPVVLTGDLNTPEGSELYQNITSGLLIDSKVAAKNSHSAGTFNYFLPQGWDLGIVIDYILVQPSAFHVANYQVLTDAAFEYQGQLLPLSDHFPVVVDLIVLK